MKIREMKKLKGKEEENVIMVKRLRSNKRKRMKERCEEGRR